MPPTRLSRAQNPNADTRISRFRSFTNFDKMIDSKTVRCKCGVVVRLDRPFKTTNFERHINSHNCILGIDNQPSLYVFFDQSKDAQEEREEEFLKPLPCTVVVYIQNTLLVLRPFLVVEKGLKQLEKQFFPKSFYKILLFLVKNLIRIKLNNLILHYKQKLPGK